MASQAGQDAKFFTRGKIQVRMIVLPTSNLRSWTDYSYTLGISRRASCGGIKGQEIHEAQDGVEEDSSKHYYGQ